MLLWQTSDGGNLRVRKKLTGVHGKKFHRKRNGVGSGSEIFKGLIKPC